MNNMTETSENMNSKNDTSSMIYVLAVSDYTSYHEGVELWFAKSLNELVEIVNESWDWIETYQFNLTLRTFGQNDYQIIADNNHEDYSFDNINVEKYNDLVGDLPNEIYV